MSSHLVDEGPVGGTDAQFAVHDGTARLEQAVYLYEGAPVGWPPQPAIPKPS